MPDSDEVNKNCFENITQSRFQTIGGSWANFEKEAPYPSFNERFNVSTN